MLQPPFPPMGRIQLWWWEWKRRGAKIASDGHWQSWHVGVPLDTNNMTSSSASPSPASAPASISPTPIPPAPMPSPDVEFMAPQGALGPVKRQSPSRPRKGNPIVRDIPYVALQPSEVRVAGGCAFDGCPVGHPFIYYMTSYRNRGVSYNRWVRSVVADVQSPVNKVPAQCLCLAVADFNDVVSGVPIGLALEDWPYDKAVISLHGPFKRAGGFQRCIDHLVTTPKEKSLMFFVDADMIAYPGLLNRIVQYTVQGVVSAAQYKAACVRDFV